MKKIALLLAVCCLALLTGCGSQLPQPIPPAQLFTQVCIASETVNTVAVTIPGIDVKVVAAATAAEPIVEKVCGSGVTLTEPNLQAFLNDALPVLTSVVAALPPDTKDLATIKLGMALAPEIVPQIIASLPVPVVKLESINSAPK